MTQCIRRDFAATARGRISFEVSGPEHAPALIFFGLSTVKGVMGDISRAYRERLDPFYRFLVCDYPVGVGASERFDNPPPMTPEQVAADYLAIADAAGFDRFACAGYSYGANTSIQLALRNPERLMALIVGGWPALDGDFESALAVCKRQRAATPDATLWATAMDDFITYYEALQHWDERRAARNLTMPRLNFADSDDRGYPGVGMGIEIGAALVRNEAELRAMGWETHILDTQVAADERHVGALQPDIVVPLLREFLGRALVNDR